MTSAKALGNSWLFTRNVDFMVDRYANSTATFVSEEAERAVVEQYRNRRHRPPVTEWSDMADPFEPAGWADWSPVRSVRLATPAKKSHPRLVEEENRQYLALRRERKQIASAVAALLTGRARRFRSDRGRQRSLKVDAIPAIRADLHSRMGACS